MEALTLAGLATKAVAAVLSGAGGEFGKKGVETAGRLWDWLKKRFAGDEEHIKAIEAMEAAPRDEDVQDDFRHLIKQAAKKDLAFAERLQEFTDEIAKDSPVIQKVKASGGSKVGVIAGDNNEIKF